MDLKRKVATGIATGALLANVVAPMAFAGTTIEISGNGSGSENWVETTQSSNTTVTQNNVAEVQNIVEAEA